MNKLIGRIFIAHLLFLLMPVIAYAATERVGDFALLDEQGEFHQLSRYQHREAVVLLALSAECAASMDAASTLASLQDRHSSDNFEFLILETSGADRDTRRDWDMPFPVLADELQLVSESLNISHQGEVLVFNPERLSLFFRGSVSVELSDTLANVSAGQVSDTATSEVQGCGINYAALAEHKESPPDYATEVAPIIIDNCSTCHRWGGAGPFPFDSYLSLLGWSPMVREVVLNKRMPPMQVDNELASSASAHFISAEDKQKLIHWMAAGAPRGDGEIDPLEEASASIDDEWELGEPDFIVEAPTYTVPAVGIQDYVYMETSLPFDEDKWVQAFHYLPGDTRVLHHLMTFIVPPEGDFWGNEKDSTTSTRRFLGSFIPGPNLPTVFAEGTAVKIPAGHKLAMQFHYVTNGLEIKDDTRIGLYFSDSTDFTESTEILTQAVSDRFTIEANDPRHDMHVSYEFDKPVLLSALRARMNYRGKNMKFVLEYPGGGQEELFSIPAYNYGWQPHYFLDEPRQLEAGTKVHVIGAFDNSQSNPFNPDPREEVSWGIENWDEMFTGYLTFSELVGD